jgi:hypothetical protein
MGCWLLLGYWLLPSGPSPSAARELPTQPDTAITEQPATEQPPPEQPSTEQPATKKKQPDNQFDPAAIEFFEKRIRPLLIENCFECHADDQHEGGLRLDSRAAILSGGDSGPAIQLDSPRKSLLLEAIGYKPDAVVQMPPDGKLPDRAIAELTRWVGSKAPWPGTRPTPMPDGTSRENPAPGGDPAEELSVEQLYSAEQLQHWAFQPVMQSPLPEVNAETWVRRDLDRFILARLEAESLQPAPEADKTTWLRRATFDLIGLPPTPEEIDTFLADDTPEAFQRVIDRLLDSPRYGERWGRHWLDVARYADSNGMDENMAYANAFRYRDYVIRAFNQDMPYDRFVRQQVAGDLLPRPEDDSAWFDQLTATGFLALGPKMLAEDDPVKMQMDIIDEQVEALGRTFMGMTLGCARCHDHKFDPISTRDYYALAGIFKSTQTMENFKVVAQWYERPLATPEATQALSAHQQKILAQTDQIEQLQQQGRSAYEAEALRRADEYLVAAAELNRHRAAKAEMRPLMEVAANEQPPAGAVVLEAESFARGNVKRDFDTYGKEIGVLVNMGQLPNFVDYDVEVPSGGAYQIELRLAAAAARGVVIKIDETVLNTNAADTVTGSWTPESQRWIVGGMLRLKAGSHVIRIERAGPFPHMDKLALVPRGTSSEIQVEMPLSADQLARQHQLIPALLKNWADQLAQDETAPRALLRGWLAVDRLKDATTRDGGASSPLGRAIDHLHQEVTAAYADLFRQAAAAQQADNRDNNQNNDNQDKPHPGRFNSPALLAAAVEFLQDSQGPFVAPAEIEPALDDALKTQLAAKLESLQLLQVSLPQLPHAMGVTDSKPEDIAVHIRGSHMNLGTLVSRRVPQVLAGEEPPQITDQASGRLELARWMTREDHPLTARVMVNRVWRWHFGQGLVRSVDNFGTTGDRPEHGPLLDHLALRFMADGWSVKSLHREIMLSAAYRMSTAYDPRAAELDPDNRLHWRMNRRRLEAEALRDALLAISGTLDTTMGGTLLTTKNHTYVNSTGSRGDVDYHNQRRSVYLPVVRSGLFEMFQAYDFPDPSTIHGDRTSTTVAPQALFMLNAPLMDQQSAAWAERLLTASPDAGVPQSATSADASASDAAPSIEEDAARLGVAFRQAYGRDPTAEETRASLEFLDRYEQALRQMNPVQEMPRRAAWAALARTIMASNEFLYLE